MNKKNYVEPKINFKVFSMVNLLIASGSKDDDTIIGADEIFGA